MFLTNYSFRSIILFLFTGFYMLQTPLAYAQQDESSQTEETKKLYKLVDKHGRIYYSDQPQAGAEEVKTPPMQAIPMQTPNINFPQSSNNPSKLRDPAAYYESLGFVGLQNGGVIRNNGGLVILTAALQPELSKEHYLQFYIDGQSSGEKQKNYQFQADNVEYGSHKAYFEVVTGSGLVVQTSPIIEFTLLHTARQKARASNLPINKSYQINLPDQPKVPTYDAMQKLISGSQKDKPA